MANLCNCPREFIEKLSDENRRFYGSPDGRGLLNVVELTFGHRWVYLYELVQNALDVGATAIAIRIGEADDALIFQHNGDRSLDQNDVEGLSKVFRSTKGARSVGFMGIGFKSVFMRFQEARISGWSWNFRYEITQVVGEEFGDVQRDLLGAVVPIWDDAIPPPDDGYTTRFEMRRRTDEGADLRSDLVRFLPDDDRASLAILTMSGLVRLDVNGRIWELGVSKEPDGSFEATALSESENRLWRIFPAEFQPSREAIACFLEHRKIPRNSDTRERVYADAARRRQLIGVLPLDNAGTPAPPSSGRVYATLPTEVKLPFGLHINADWLLNISRSGLREIEDNPWQRDILEKVPDILVRFLDWSANTYSHPEAAKAAFKVLRQPSAEAGGLESLLAEEHWLSMLRDRIKDSPVLPVWTETTGTVAYAKPGDTFVPPATLAKAFTNQPELRPAILLKGHVLRDDVLGRNAIGLLRRLGLLTKMSPQELEGVWDSGLEDWWDSLPDDQVYRRRLLFRLWAAVADLSSDDAWQNLNVRCVRSVIGDWVSVGEAAFLNEALASDQEPGGPATRQLMNPFIPDANRLDTEWVTALRQRRQNDRDHEILSRAWTWIEDNARSISLREVVVNALDAQILSPHPDLSVFAPLGHWAKHRDRADLLTHVLAQSNGERLGVPVGDALLADPYVDQDQDRRRLWSGVPAIDGDYVETDPKSAGTHEWRTFFEKAGAKGTLEVRSMAKSAARWERERVAEFLGCDVDAIYGSNDSGYNLLDFDIVPSLPGPDAPRELRAAVAPWLNDGFRVLNGKGTRKVSYFFRSRYELKGNKASAWVAKLSELAWVPCDDNELRYPRDVLGVRDPARKDAPFSILSSHVLDFLDREGVKFGTTIPEATSLRRLLAVGSDLDADELADLLFDCREQATSDKDRQLLDQALRKLTLPTTENRRVTLDRIVHRIGGRLRGSLGGWVVPLDHIEETLRAELQRGEFPHEFPETTTGAQALDYVADVWRRARSSPQGLANEVRDVLPTAYGYFLEDLSKHDSLLKRWQEKASQVMVFADGKWIALSETNDIYIDDIEDRRFLPRQGQLQTVTAGHLGHDRRDQLRTAEAIGLPLLSSVVTMEWNGGVESLPISDTWTTRFELIIELLRAVRGSEQHNDWGTDTETSTRLIHVSQLELDVRVGSFRVESVPVNARLHEGSLTVAGRPLQFGADATKELLRYFSFGQRAGLAADLTGMFMAIDDTDFALAADKFRRSHVPAFKLTEDSRHDLESKEDKVSGDRSGETIGIAATNGNADTDRPVSNEKTQPTETSKDADDVPFNIGEADDIKAATSGKPELEGSDSVGGSYSRERALAKQNILANQLKNSLKGEIVPSPEEEDAVEVSKTNRDSDGSLGDEEYREVAAKYEKEAGRDPELADPHQSGWDIRSVDPETQEVRLIEVKGRGRPWEDVEVVELSHAQVRKAFEANDSWYLYVVEKTIEGSYQVLPIENPVRVAAKWILCGESWRMVAEDARVVTHQD